MNIQTILPIVLVVLVVIAVALIITWLVFRLRSQRLKHQFGSEYDYALEKTGDRRSAEADLKEREKRVSSMELKSLGDAEKDRYHQEWIEAQAGFVDDPAGAVEKGNRLVTEVMIARGFPVAEFEQRSADLSVPYPNSVPGYRQANDILMKNRNGGASTEELRQAMINFHSLFDQLLETVHTPQKEMPTKELETTDERETVSK